MWLKKCNSFVVLAQGEAVCSFGRVCKVIRLGCDSSVRRTKSKHCVKDCGLAQACLEHQSVPVFRIESTRELPRCSTPEPITLVLLGYTQEAHTHCSWANSRDRGCGGVFADNYLL